MCIFVLSTLVFSFPLFRVTVLFFLTLLQSRTKSLKQCCNIHIFLSFLGSLLKQCILFEIFLKFSLPPPYTKLKLGKNSGYRRPTMFVGWGQGLDLCEFQNASETQKCPKTFVHDCSSFLSGIASLSLLRTLVRLNGVNREVKHHVSIKKRTQFYTTRPSFPFICSLRTVHYLFT